MSNSERQARWRASRQTELDALRKRVRELEGAPNPPKSSPVAQGTQEENRASGAAAPPDPDLDQLAQDIRENYARVDRANAERGSAVAELESRKAEYGRAKAELRASEATEWTLEKVVEWCQDEYIPRPNLWEIGEAAQAALDDRDDKVIRERFRKLVLDAYILADDLSGVLSEIDDACLCDDDN
jgi:hypothetical protein